MPINRSPDEIRIYKLLYNFSEKNNNKMGSRFLRSSFWNKNDDLEFIIFCYYKCIILYQEETVVKQYMKHFNNFVKTELPTALQEQLTNSLGNLLGCDIEIFINVNVKSNDNSSSDEEGSTTAGSSLHIESCSSDEEDLDSETVAILDWLRRIKLKGSSSQTNEKKLVRNQNTSCNPIKSKLKHK